MKDMDSLKQQVMMNQFMFATGCQVEQAKQFLVASKWQFEVRNWRLSVFSKMAHVYILINYKQWVSVLNCALNNHSNKLHFACFERYIIFISECSKYVLPRIFSSDMSDVQW